MKPRRQKLTVKWHTDPQGVVSLKLAIPRIDGPKPDAFGKRYWLADIDQMLPAKVRCGSVDVQPRVVLKVFCPVPKSVIATNQRARKRAAIVKGESLLTM